MRRPTRMRPQREPGSEKRSFSASARDRLAILLGLVTAGCLALAFVLNGGTQFLMPGPLASAHGTIENCGTCHTKSGTGKVTWLHSFMAGDPVADSKACLTCHKMPKTAFNAHSASPNMLKASTQRLDKVAAATPAPISARAQNIAFPTQDVAKDGLYCATCHQEHKGADFDLTKISNAQCQSCHVVKFDSFDGNHPKFENYPFERRTRITYDHAGHFRKHFPEVAQKEPKKVIPTNCATCHNSRDDKRMMVVAPFEQVCSKCHLDQITGKARATGPKGIAFLSLPGLDLETLKSKNASIGEWPDVSDAPVTPFMKLLIAQNDQGRALIKRIEALNLSDLADASDDDIAQVTKFVWRVKRLFYSLVTAKASEALAGFDLGGGIKAGPDLLADLTASLPRDVVLAAQREWLPNLGKEIASGKEAGGKEPGSWTSSVTESKLSASVTPEDLGSVQTTPGGSQRIAQADNVQVQPKRVPGSAASKPTPGTDAAPSAGAKDGAPAEPQAAASDTLTPADASASPDAAASKPAEEANPASAAPAAAIENDVDAESWADHGGWYRQDYALLYRPVGHKDRFIYAWLGLTGPRAQTKDDKSPAAAVFDALTGKDAQGSCTKCHSVDELGGKGGRRVNFAPASAKTKQGRFTNFIHEPHFGIMEKRGCLTCHNLNKRPYLKSYEQGNPLNFDSNFSGVKKEICTGCHTANMARQDCLLCHKYHVDGVITPTMRTKLPTQ